MDRETLSQLLGVEFSNVEERTAKIKETQERNAKIFAEVPVEKLSMMTSKLWWLMNKIAQSAPFPMDMLIQIHSLALTEVLKEHISKERLEELFPEDKKA